MQLYSLRNLSKNNLLHPKSFILHSTKILLSFSREGEGPRGYRGLSFCVCQRSWPLYSKYWTYNFCCFLGFDRTVDNSKKIKTRAQDHSSDMHLPECTGTIVKKYTRRTYFFSRRFYVSRLIPKPVLTRLENSFSFISHSSLLTTFHRGA